MPGHASPDKVVIFLLGVFYLTAVYNLNIIFCFLNFLKKNGWIYRGFWEGYSSF